MWPIKFEQFQTFCSDSCMSDTLICNQFSEGSDKMTSKPREEVKLENVEYMHAFPAVQGRQAGKAFFIAMCPMKLIPRLFVFDEEEVPPQMRAQRTLNHARVPQIAKYLVDNLNSYILPALTASINAPVNFVTAGGENQSALGLLQIPMDAQILINDGQHRRAAIEAAIKVAPELGQDNVPVLFFVDEGLVRSQQMFSDLNQFGVRPSRSLGILYDHRSAEARLATYLAEECVPFRSLIEMEKSTISNRSTKLFTLSSIKHATRALLRKSVKDDYAMEERLLAKDFWDVVSEQIPDWARARTRDVSTSELRQNFVHAHGIALHALGIAGAALMTEQPKTWKTSLRALRTIDWSRSNTAMWEGRAMTHGRISKTSINVQLTAHLLMQILGVTVTRKCAELKLRLPVQPLAGVEK
jgi:DNA sulfur modification protein DndB